MEDAPYEILSPHACHLGEGPAYEGASDTAWWFDILEKTMFEAKVASRVVKKHLLPTMASEVAAIDEERQLVATADGLYVRDRASGRLELLRRLEEDNDVTRSNDGRVHPCGALWIGTMGRNAETGAGSIYWFFRGELRRLWGNITIPNAIAFSPKGDVGYFVDTREGLLKRVTLDPASGLPTGEPTTLYDHRGEDGGMDGAVVDAEGLIWNARWGAGCLDVYTTEGERVRTVRVPASRPTCPIFVGHGFDRLLVTTASEGMDDAAKAADPLHGQTFIFDVKARGLAEPRVKPFAS
jgi:sugar lactone lactonase